MTDGYCDLMSTGASLAGVIVSVTSGIPCPVAGHLLEYYLVGLCMLADI